MKKTREASNLFDNKVLIGEGMGLADALEIVDDHERSITVKHELGVGTNSFIRIPVDL